MSAFQSFVLKIVLSIDTRCSSVCTFNIKEDLINSQSIAMFTLINFINLFRYLSRVHVIGDTANVPDSVMGLTFLAAGTSLPEAVSSVIVTNQGHGAMGISSSISSNTFDILLCLGIPWFLKAYFVPDIAGQHWVSLSS